MAIPNVGELIRGRRDWRVMLETDYQATARRLTEAYQRITPRLRARVDALMTEYNELVDATGGYPSPTAVKGLRSYSDLLSQIEVEMRDFGVIAREATARLQEQAIQMALPGVFEQVAAQVPDAQIIADAWVRPDPEALTRLIGYVDSAEMRAKFADFGVNAANNFADGLLALTAQGKNPTMIARYISGWSNVPYAWAENMARTTQIYSYRTATHAAYLANADLMDGWMWRAALDSRTCMSCISKHGQVFPVSVTLNDHHRGRCAPVPVVKGSTWVSGVETGRDWYARLPNDVQRRISGDLMFQALKENKIRWDDLSQPYKDDVFGEMLREASVSELIESKQIYRNIRMRAKALAPNRTTERQAARIAAEVRTGS